MQNPPNDIAAHTPGTKKGEEWTLHGHREPGRENDKRTARDATSINPKRHAPIDPRMPNFPPA
jgi:hypothetical protein